MAATEASRKLGERLREHFAAQKSGQIQLAAKYGVSQGWISRIFDGEFTVRSAIARDMCVDAGIPFLREKRETERAVARDLKRELLATWDGSEQEARQITQILRALKALKASKSQDRPSNGM